MKIVRYNKGHYYHIPYFHLIIPNVKSQNVLSKKKNNFILFYSNIFFLRIIRLNVLHTNKFQEYQVFSIRNFRILNKNLPTFFVKERSDIFSYLIYAFDQA